VGRFCLGNEKSPVGAGLGVEYLADKVLEFLEVGEEVGFVLGLFLFFGREFLEQVFELAGFGGGEGDRGWLCVTGYGRGSPFSCCAFEVRAFEAGSFGLVEESCLGQASVWRHWSLIFSGSWFRLKVSLTRDFDLPTTWARVSWV
jgi:hypothetical protein